VVGLGVFLIAECAKRGPECSSNGNANYDWIGRMVLSFQNCEDILAGKGMKGGKIL